MGTERISCCPEADTLQFIQGMSRDARSPLGCMALDVLRYDVPLQPCIGTAGCIILLKRYLPDLEHQVRGNS